MAFAVGFFVKKVVNEPNILRWNVSWKNEIALTEIIISRLAQKCQPFFVIQILLLPLVVSHILKHNQYLYHGVYSISRKSSQVLCSLLP